MSLFRQRLVESQGFEKSTTVIRHCNLHNAGGRVVLGGDPDGGMAKLHWTPMQRNTASAEGTRPQGGAMSGVSLYAGSRVHAMSQR